MAKSLFLVASLLLLLLPLSLAAAAAEPQIALADVKTTTEAEKKQPGECVPIENITDPHIQNLGKFAVEQHNKDYNTHLQFLKVISGCFQIFGQGTKYDLSLMAFDGSVIRSYFVIVFEDLKKNLTLIKFQDQPPPSLMLFHAKASLI